MHSIFHCTVHKAASTWFRDLFRHEAFLRHHPVPVYHYETDLKKQIYENYTKQTIVMFPAPAIVTNVYCDYQSFLRHPRVEHFKAFYFYKDPREIIISTYWSWGKNHIGGHPNRQKIESMSFEDGLMWTIDELGDRLGKFDAMRSWMEDCDDERIKFYSSEKFFTDDWTTNLLDLFDWIEVSVPYQDFEILSETFSFEKLSGGRKPGEEKKESHFRTGKTGTWQEMPNEVLDYYYERTGNLTELLGYER